MGTATSSTGGTPVDTVTTGPIQGSVKHYHEVDGLRIPVRRINLTNGEHFDVFDTSGPYTDPVAIIDVRQGLAPVRSSWRGAAGRCWWPTSTPSHATRPAATA